MAWQLYQVIYELRSPLHIGYHKIGAVQRTRYYVPARNVWGAVTERLTRSGFTASGTPEGDYAKVGEWVKAHCAFSYWFFHDGQTLLYPRYSDEGVHYGHLSESEFERRYLSAHVTTALDAATTSAEVGSLHEIEIVGPNGSNGAGRLLLTGWVFLDSEAGTLLGEEEQWKRWLGDLQVGGERRYGFGRLRLTQNGWRMGATGQFLDGYRADCSRDRPRIELGKEKSLLAHTVAQVAHASGAIEPLVGRDTVGSDRFGRRLTKAELCWVPGSVCEEALWLEISPEEIWRRPAT